MSAPPDMSKEFTHPVVRKKTICQSSSSFGYCDVNMFSKETYKKSKSQERVPSDSKETTLRKVSKIHPSQDNLRQNSKLQTKLLAEQKALWRQKTKFEKEMKQNKLDRRKENLKELHEKAKKLLQQNLKKKVKRMKNTSSAVAITETPKNSLTDLTSKEVLTDVVIENIPNLSIDDITVTDSKKACIASENITLDVNSQKPNLVSNSNLENKNKVSEEIAAVTIQKYFRGFTARKNFKMTKFEMKSDKIENVAETTQQSTDNSKPDALVLPDLYISYPYNIMSSVKSKFFPSSNVEVEDIDKHVNEKHTESTSQLETVSITPNLNGRFFNEKLDIPSAVIQYKALELSKRDTVVYNSNSIKKSDTALYSKETLSMNRKNGPTSQVNRYDSEENLLSAPEISLIWFRNAEMQIANKNTLTTQFLPNSFQDGLNLLESFNDSLRQLQNIEKVRNAMCSCKMLNTNKNTLTPQFLQFQDELNLLESFNDSLRQLQNIEKKLTSIRKDDILVPDEAINHEVVKENDSTKLTFISDSDTFQPNKNSGQNENPNRKRKNMLSCDLHKKRFNSNKNIVISQKDNIIDSTTNTSDILISENDSVLEKSVVSCSSSIDSSKYEKPFFNLNKYKNDDMTNRLNKFCLCLVSQYIEDEKVHLEYLNTLLKVREKSLLDATRNELLCLEIQKKKNHSQIPLLKKKQRGLLLKLQQERNEIKHIKKFQQEQSQERKASLRRQLKNLKQMLACDEIMFNRKKKNSSASAILQISKNSINSPLKGINITLSNESHATNNALTKVWECLEKRRQDINEQKQKMHDILNLHLNNTFETAEMKIIQDKLTKLPSNVENINIDPKTDTVSGISSNDPEPLQNQCEITNDTSGNKIDTDENINSYKRFSGSTLNTLWEKITGHKCEKYENNKLYNMTKDSLDTFFNDAKQVAVNNMLSTLHYNVRTESPKQDSIEEPFTHCFATNKIESTSVLNNLLKSEGRELADLLYKDKEARQELLNKNENNFGKESEKMYSENMSNDGSDTSKSTAHSLVEELSYLYPNADNYLESENENHSTLSPLKIESQYAGTQNIINSQQPSELIVKTNTANIVDKHIPNELSTESEIMGSKSSSKFVDSLINTNTLEPLQENIVQNKDCPTTVIDQKQQKKDNSVNGIDGVIKTDVYVDNTVGLSPKRFYTDDQNISRLLENKSPVNADYLSGSWESVSPSPDPSPRDSPTGEYSPAAASLPLCHLSEAEELRRKQLAIELEIKALEQQQTQIPYCLVREIPDKPPPPYIPPSDETKVIVLPVKVVEPKSPPSIPSLIESFCVWLWNKFSEGKSELIVYSDYDIVNKFINNFHDYMFVFDVCLETFRCEYSQILYSEPVQALPWEYMKDTNNKNKKIDKEEMCNSVQSKVKDLIGIETTPIRENLIISWTQKRQDFVNNLLIKELYKEESNWLNIEPFEMDLKNNLTNSILDSLILEACNELKSIIL